MSGPRLTAVPSRREQQVLDWLGENQSAPARDVLERAFAELPQVRQRRAWPNVSATTAGSSSPSRRVRSASISASRAGRMSSALVAQMSCQMSAGLDARRVVSVRPGPASAM